MIQKYLSKATTYIGYATIAHFALKALKILTKPIQNINIYKEYGQNGGYALITGGSSGLGFEYAKILAKKGFNLILISRNLQNLNEARNNLLQTVNNKIDIQIIEFDMSFIDPQNYQQLAKKLEVYKITVLINNFAAFIMKPFHQYDLTLIQKSVSTNIFSVMFLCNIFINQNRKIDQKCLIANVGSVAGAVPLAEYVVHASTKGLIHHFTKCLQKELKKTNINVVLLIPGLTRTPMLMTTTQEFQQSFEFRAFSVDSDKVARAQLNSIGKYKQVIGTLRHNLYYLFKQLE